MPVVALLSGCRTGVMALLPRRGVMAAPPRVDDVDVLAGSFTIPEEARRTRGLGGRWIGVVLLRECEIVLLDLLTLGACRWTVVEVRKGVVVLVWACWGVGLRWVIPSSLLS